MNIDGIVLPNDLEWEDEISWTPIAQNSDYSASGALLLQESVRLSGRPITLVGSGNVGYLKRTKVLELLVKRNQPGLVMVLTLNDARIINVMFAQSQTAIDVVPIKSTHNFDENRYYRVNALRFMEVN